MENQDAQPAPPTQLVAQGNEQTGVVKKWIIDRGFGFISSNGDDIFCHITALKPEGSRTELNIGENVVFEVGQDERTGKNRAENVRGEGNGKPPEQNPNPRIRGGRGRGRYRERGGRGYNRNGGNDRNERYSNNRRYNSNNNSSGGYQSRSDNQNWRSTNPTPQFNQVSRQPQYGQYGQAASNTYQFQNQYQQHQGQAPTTYYSPNPQQFGMQQQQPQYMAAQQYSTRNAENTMPAAYQRLEEDVRTMKLHTAYGPPQNAAQATFPQQQQAQTPQAPNTPQAAQAQPASSFTPVQTQQPAPQIPAQPAYTSSATFGQGSFQQVTGQPGTFQQN